MRHLVFVLCLFQLCALHAAGLITEEIYYDENKTRVIGKKEYIYNERNNIVCVVTANSKGVKESRIVYTYDMDKLLSLDEYSGDSEESVIFSIFVYDGQNRVEKKTDYNKDQKLFMTHVFGRDSRGLLNAVLDYSPDGVYLGRKEFIFNKNVPVEERLLDEKDNVLITKKFSMKGENIHTIEFYSKTGSRVRVVERKYGSFPVESSNFWGYRDNFYDYR